MNINHLMIFPDSFVSNSFIIYILRQTRNTSHSKTLIDIAFSIFLHEIISSNITATISDHLHQFLFIFSFISII